MGDPLRFSPQSLQQLLHVDPLLRPSAPLLEHIDEPRAQSTSSSFVPGAER